MSPFCCFKAEHMEEVSMSVCMYMYVCVTEQACFSGSGGRRSHSMHAEKRPLKYLTLNTEECALCACFSRLK